MALNSVNTNMGAMVALQSLNKTSDAMETTQKRISTGFRVADAKDDGAAFAVAQKVRADVSGLTSANEQLGGVKGILDTTMSALTNVSETMQSIRATLTKLADGNIAPDSTERQQYTKQLQEQIKQVNNFLADATYNGQRLITDPSAGDATGPAEASDIITLRNESGGTITITGYASGEGSGAALTLDTNFTNGTNATSSGILDLSADTATSVITVADAKWLLGGDDTAAEPSGADTNLSTTAWANMTTFKSIESNINVLLNNYGSTNKLVDGQINYNKAKMDALESGLGALVDADLAKESAKMQSLQIRQQLGTQALSMANQAPQSLLSLFR